MGDDILKNVYETFGGALKKALMSENTISFRLCVDEKDNISTAKFSTGIFPVCPQNTKKIIDVVIKPEPLKR